VNQLTVAATLAAKSPARTPVRRSAIFDPTRYATAEELSQLGPALIRLLMIE
jgi:hypothetical protein